MGVAYLLKLSKSLGGNLEAFMMLEQISNSHEAYTLLLKWAASRAVQEIVHRLLSALGLIFEEPQKSKKDRIMAVASQSPTYPIRLACESCSLTEPG
jgi:hypothetical protein